MAAKRSPVKKSPPKKSPAKRPRAKALPEGVKRRGGRPPKGTPTKADFIREKLAAGMSPAAIVEAAKEQGVEIGSTMVYKVRARAAGKATVAAPATTGDAQPTAGKKMTASAFVRTLPADMGPADVIAAGAKAGYKISRGLVYMARSVRKKRGGGAAPGAPSRGKRSAPARAPADLSGLPASGGGSELELKKAALAVGFPRALRVIEELARRAEAVLKQYQALLG
ncbi:MAG: hypothetical protein FJ104_07660 [Deltaproteobacteria bacterium]|nr:hypothetical protein [Deltaproteobacteria bacterium]